VPWGPGPSRAPVSPGASLPGPRSRAANTTDRWTVELDFSTGEEELLFGLTIVAGETFASMHDAASAVADAIELDLRLARGCVRH